MYSSNTLIKKTNFGPPTIASRRTNKYRLNASTKKSKQPYVEERESVGQKTISQPDVGNLVSATKNEIWEQLQVNRAVIQTKDIPNKDLYYAVGYAAKSYLVQKLLETQEFCRKKQLKQVYYLSAEFLVGRALTNVLINLQLWEPYKQAMMEYGKQLEDIATQERDASLGNGGLGRLAACYVDSMASCQLPGWGYGIRYEYGMFRQKLVNNRQVEVADVWDTDGYPFELRRPDVRYRVNFGGATKQAKGHQNPVSDKYANGNQGLFQPRKWEPTEVVVAQAYDNPQAGYKNDFVGNLRLWDCQPVQELDLTVFNEGNYDKCTKDLRDARLICSVLYPNDATEQGKELRLKQQYFFVSASMQDALARFVEDFGEDWEKIPSQMTFQLNDTHPAISIAEFMHQLVDNHNVPFEKAWLLCQKTFNYTNHTVLPEALEKWPTSYLDRLLPRHMEIIKAINQIYLAQTNELVQGKEDLKRLVQTLSIVHPNQWNPNEQVVNMAYLAIAGAVKVNGVAEIHSDIIKAVTFANHAKIRPDQYINVTNGVSTRRWLRNCNPELSEVINEALGTQRGEEWVTKPEVLQGLSKYSNDQSFQNKWAQAKFARKNKVLDYIEKTTDYKIANRNGMLDVQIKRIHEYKRQFLNLLSIIHRYEDLKSMPAEQRESSTSRICVMAGKAASSYDTAKRIIGLACDIGKTINNDPDTNKFLQVFFLEDYNVSLAELLIPGTELSQHISTAGTEASGTSNMKFTMNGALILGTYDGANIEITREVGEKNVFIFGARANEIEGLRKERKNLKVDSRFEQVCKSINAGKYGDKEYYKKLVDSVYNMNVGNDYYLLANDFADYLDKQNEVDRVYQDKKEWNRRSIEYTANSKLFSSDRAIREYADNIWGLKSCVFPYNTQQLLSE